MSIRLLMILPLLVVSACANEYASKQECEKSLAIERGAETGAVVGSLFGDGYGQLASVLGGAALGGTAGYLEHESVSENAVNDQRTYERGIFTGCRVKSS